MGSNNRKILIERFRESDGNLKYIAESGINEKGKHYIGRLEGPSASFLHSTRNDRLYDLRLWKKVEASSDFKEGMQTLTIFGEADHPLDRLETSIKEIAICLRKFEIQEDKGIVWCSFDILDTPNGRIVKELLDYGSKLGVSSRGSGEEIIGPDGQTIIDPDSYIFICFDVVIMPAVIEARPSVVESTKLGTKSLVESIQREIDNASTTQELNSIKNIIEKQNIPGIDSIMESLNKQLESKSGDDVSNQLIADLGNLTERNNKLEENNNKLSLRLSASEARVSELRQVIKEKASISRKLRKCIKDNERTISSLESNILESHEQYNDYYELVESLKNQNFILKSRYNDLKESSESLKKELSEKDNRIRINESMRQAKANTKIINDKKVLAEKNTILQNKVKELSESVRNQKVIQEKLTKVESHNKNLLSENRKILTEYINVKAYQCGLSPNVIINKLPKNYNLSSINKLTEELLDRKVKMNRIPITLPEGSRILNPKAEIPDEDIQTLSILEGVKKKL